MQKHTIIGMLVGGALMAGAALPLIASAQTLSTDQLRAQINSLLQQITTLRAQMVPPASSTMMGSSTSAAAQMIGAAAQNRVCTMLARNLSIGTQGDDVHSLQEFLQARGDLAAQPTGFFGPLTAEAVARWQTSQGVSPIGIFGPQSRERLLAWCGGGYIDSSINPPGTSPVAPPNPIRFTAVPVSGAAPLTAKFYSWTPFLTHVGTSFMIDFGDGASAAATNCTGPTDTCTGISGNTHTYTTNGSYTATLIQVTNPCANRNDLFPCTSAVFREEVGRVQIRVGPQACTMEYAPVCGLKPIVCITTPCNPVPTTYGNRCAMEADGATFSSQGECQLVTPTPPISDAAKHRICRLLGRSLQTGMQGDDVRGLQEFLKDRGFLSVDPTGFFGSLTAYGVAQWQNSVGLPGVGIFGPQSRERLLAWCGGGAPIVPTPIPTPVSELSASPLSGSAPLAVTFRTGTINASYFGGVRLDFGDGQSSQVCRPGGGCAATSLAHTYTSAGTYRAILRGVGEGSGQILGTATITVGGPQACTMEYAPVCGSKQVQCITAPCNPVQETYSNRCMMNAAGATFVKEGQCSATTANPENDPRCKAWYDGCNSCSRSTPGGPAMCTLRACLNDTAAVKYCTAYFSATEANQPPVITSFAGPTTLAVNTSGTWTIQASDPEQGTLRYMVQWGDEWYARSGYYTDSIYPGAPIVQTGTFTHSYAAPGSYTVRVLVRDEAGKEAKTSATVQVGGVY